MVTLLFDECAELWSGCPAVEAMDNGIETSEEISVSENPEETASGLRSLADWMSLAVTMILVGQPQMQVQWKQLIKTIDTYTYKKKLNF